MSKKAFVIDTPKDCLHCELRMCIHIDKKCYQKCGLDFVPMLRTGATIAKC